MARITEHHPYRRTGRTFRAILNALRMASEGEQVFYLAPTKEAISYAFDMATRILKDTIAPSGETVIVPARKFIEFQSSKGKLSFIIPMDERESRHLLGIKDPKTIVDLD